MIDPRTCGNVFPLKDGHVCELLKDHDGDHEATCPNPQFHQTWHDAAPPAQPERKAFEAWYKAKHGHSFFWEPDWEIWQAASQERTPSDTPPALGERKRFESEVAKHLGDERFLLRDQKQPDKYDAYLVDHLWWAWKTAQRSSVAAEGSSIVPPVAKHHERLKMQRETREESIERIFNFLGHKTDQAPASIKEALFQAYDAATGVAVEGKPAIRPHA